MDNAACRNIHAQAACPEAGVYGAATDCASPTWGRIGKNLRCVSAICTKTHPFGAAVRPPLGRGPGPGPAVDADQGMSGNLTPRVRNRTAGTRALEEKTGIARRFPLRPLVAIPSRKSRHALGFVRNARRCGEDTRNPAEFLASSPHPQDQKSHLSSCRNRIDSTPRPLLAFHVLVIEIRCFPDQ